MMSCFNEADAFASDQLGVNIDKLAKDIGFNEADAFASDQLHFDALNRPVMPPLQ